jgi:hypothetical protein
MRALVSSVRLSTAQQCSAATAQVKPAAARPHHPRPSVLRGFKSILHYMAYKHLVGIARTDLSIWGSTWLVVRTNFSPREIRRAPRDQKL